MGLIPDASLTRIRALVERTMGDSCQRLQRVQQGTDGHGRPVFVWQPVGDELVCGIKAHTSRDAEGTVISDYTIRLPYGTELDASDMLRIVARHNTPLDTPVDGDIIGAIGLGLTAVTVQLKVVSYDQ